MDRREMGGVLELAKDLYNQQTQVQQRTRVCQLDPDGHDEHLADALTKIRSLATSAARLELD
jgi:hypothetical protein